MMDDHFRTIAKQVYADTFVNFVDETSESHVALSLSFDAKDFKPFGDLARNAQRVRPPGKSGARGLQGRRLKQLG